MTKTYQAIIEGQSREVIGQDDDGRYLLAGGEKLKLTPLDPETFNALQLREVSKLTFTDGDWLLGGENLKSLCIGAREELCERHDDSNARTKAETYARLLHPLLKKSKAVCGQDQFKIKGVAWFEERRHKEDGETVKDCEERRGFLLEQGCNVGKILPKPEAFVFEPVLLTDFEIRPNGEMGQYEIRIEGRKRMVNSVCFDAQGNLELADGQRYIFERLNYNPPGQPPAEPAVDIFSYDLIEVVKLKPWQGDWKWNDEQQTLADWLNSNLQSDSPELGKRMVARSRLIELPAAKASEVCAIAFFKFDVEMDDTGTPILLKSFRPVLMQAKPEGGAQLAANLIKNAGDAAASQIRVVNSELRASTQQLAEVSQPFREMYKDDRLAGAKADGLKAGIPELVLDVLASDYHKSKLPTTDALLKHLNDSGFTSKLESGGHGTSRASIGRWLSDFKQIMQRRGLIQKPRNRAASSGRRPADATEDSNFVQGQSVPMPVDTRSQELGKDPDTDDP